MTRSFEDFDAAAVDKPQPLLVGITSPSHGGKTYSSLELATGMVSAAGGEIFLVDTESDRALHYKNLFKFRHVPFVPPHSPEAYEQAINYCVGRGARVIIIDSMSHEHGGEGGVLDQSEAFLARKAPEMAKRYNINEWEARDRLKWTSWIEPMSQRRRLNRKIVMLGGKVMFIFCYRAEDKTKPVKGGDPIHVGWTAETTSKLPYEMTVRFLLPPGSDGRPSLTPDTEFEKLSIKMPVQFRDWFKPGIQLNRALGAKLAEWSSGGVRAAGGAVPSSSPSTVGQPPAASAPSTGVNGRHAEMGPAAPEQIDEIQTELHRLGWNRKQVVYWCKKWECDWPTKIPARHAVAAVQSLATLPDPAPSEPGSDG